MSRITKKIKRKQEETRKKHVADKDSVVINETVSEDITQPKTEQVKDVLKKSFANINASFKHSTGGSYNQQSVAPVYASPQLSQQVQTPPVDPQAQPIAAPQQVVKSPSKLKTFTKNVSSIAKDQLGQSGVGQAFGMVKDLSKQFKDLFKTEEELFKEQILEEAKAKKEEENRKEKEDKLREEVLKKAGLWVDKKSKEDQKVDKTSSVNIKSDVDKSVEISGDAANDIKRIRTILESQQQANAHSLEDASEAAQQQATVVKTLQDIEKDLKDKKDVSKDFQKKDDEGFLSKLTSNLLGSVATAAFTAVAGIIAKKFSVFGKIANLASMIFKGKSAIEAAPAVVEAASTAAKGAEVAADVSKVATPASEAVSAASKGAEVAADVSKVATPVAEAATAAGALSKGAGVLKVASKVLGPLGAAVDVGTGVMDLAEGKRQTDVPEGILDKLSPMKWGMYGGEKINQAVEKTTGNSVGGNLYDAMNKEDPAEKQKREADTLATIRANKAKQSAKLQTEPAKSTADITEQMTTAAAIKPEKIVQQPPVIIQQSPVVIDGSQKEKVGLFDRRMNDNSFQRMQDRMFNGAHI